jgi:hypothetical protein
MRAIVILLLLLSPAFVFAGTPAFVGKWKLDAVRTKDGPVSKEKMAGGSMIWNFKADGTLEMTITAKGQTANSSATWTVDKTEITVNENGQVNKMTFKKVGKKLELAATTSSVVMTFVKTK